MPGYLPKLYQEFQSTLPRGSDTAIEYADGIFNEFQSTLPRGSDYCLSAPFVLLGIISIHAPSRERLKLWF